MINKIILEIRAGAGGDEAAIFAGDLSRMYQRYAAKQGWRFNIIDFNENSLKGYKTFIAEVENPSANSEKSLYDILKNETGVHRVQRVPKTEKSGRIHTSTVSVAVLPEIEEREFQINDRDLEISFFRSSGPGGQNVNKVETAVRISHKPSGLIVSSQAGRSQHANREQALNLLRAKLYEQKREEELKNLGDLRREQIGSAQRSEKIRTYNFPDDRLADHRLNKKWKNLENILDGNLDHIFEAFIQKDNQ